jgi:hypothetical protein
MLFATTSNSPAAVELRAHVLYKCSSDQGLEMRAKLILAALFGLLLCSLATLEIAELARLADDTSNDFSLPHFAQESSSKAVHSSRDLQPTAASYPPDECERPRICRWATGSSHLAKDFLHFLCVLKT